MAPETERPEPTLRELAASAALARSLARTIDERVQALLALRGIDTAAPIVVIEPDAYHALMALAELATATTAEVAERLASVLRPNETAGTGRTPDDNPDNRPN